MWAKLSAKKKSVFLIGSIIGLMIIWVGIIGITQSDERNFPTEQPGSRADFVGTETATVTVTATPLQKLNFQLGFDYTHNTNIFRGNQAAIVSAKKLIKDVGVPQTTHILGFGLSSPNPSAGKYNWRDLDARVALMRETTPVDQRSIILCCAPKWMKGTKTDDGNESDLTKAPLSKHYKDFATLSAAVAKRYPDIKYFTVWNELKGFWDAKKNRYSYENYTAFYNQVYAAIKMVRPDAKVGGPYVSADTDPPVKSKNETYGHLAPHVSAILRYWLQHKKGADFIAVDGGPQTFKPGGRPSDSLMITTDGYTAGRMFADTARSIRGLDATRYPGATSLPLWWMEFYPATEKDSKNVTPKGQHAVSIAIDNTITAGLGGFDRIHNWLVEGGFRNEPNGEAPYTGYGWWTNTSKSTGGKATPYYTAVKLLKINFPVGTQLYKTSIKGNITVLASKTKILLLSKTKNAVNVKVLGKTIALKPYEIKVITR